MMTKKRILIFATFCLLSYNYFSKKEINEIKKIEKVRVECKENRFNKFPLLEVIGNFQKIRSFKNNDENQVKEENLPKLLENEFKKSELECVEVPTYPNDEARMKPIFSTSLGNDLDKDDPNSYGIILCRMGYESFFATEQSDKCNTKLKLSIDSADIITLLDSAAYMASLDTEYCKAKNCGNRLSDYERSQFEYSSECMAKLSYQIMLNRRIIVRIARYLSDNPSETDTIISTVSEPQKKEILSELLRITFSRKNNFTEVDNIFDLLPSEQKADFSVILEELISDNEIAINSIIEKVKNSKNEELQKVLSELIKKIEK